MRTALLLEGEDSTFTLDATRTSCLEILIDVGIDGLGNASTATTSPSQEEPAGETCALAWLSD